MKHVQVHLQVSQTQLYKRLISIFSLDIKWGKHGQRTSKPAKFPQGFYTRRPHCTALEIQEQTLQDVQNGKVMGMFLIPPIKPPPTCTNAHTHTLTLEQDCVEGGINLAMCLSAQPSFFPLWEWLACFILRLTGCSSAYNSKWVIGSFNSDVMELFTDVTLSLSRRLNTRQLFITTDE